MSRINRIKKEKGFILIDKGYVNNPRLSMKAKGLMTYILGLPDDWVIYKSELPNHFADGRDAIRATLEELERHGYLTQERNKRDDKGKMLPHDITIHETPIHDGLSATGYPQRVTRDGKPVTTNTDLTNTDLTNIDLTNEPEKAQNGKPKTKTLNHLIADLQSKGFQAINNPTFLMRLEAEYQDYEHDLIAHLLEIAVEKKVKSFVYLDTILRKWDADGITTLEQLKAKKTDKQKPQRELTPLEKRLARMEETGT